MRSPMARGSARTTGCAGERNGVRLDGIERRVTCALDAGERDSDMRERDRTPRLARRCPVAWQAAMVVRSGPSEAFW